MHELDRAIRDSRLEAYKVTRGEVYNTAHPNQMEYLYFLGCAERAFHGFRSYLRSQDFADKIKHRQENITNESQS